MTKTAERLKSVEIQSLWSDRKHIVWQLRPDVNILSGGNGVGKSTILNKLESKLQDIARPQHQQQVGDAIKLEFWPDDADSIRYDIIRSFDNRLVPNNIVAKLDDGRVLTELDLRLYDLQHRYLNYQVNIGNRIIALLQSGDPDAQAKAVAVSAPKVKFQDYIDELFNDTLKRIDRSCNELQFLQYGEKLAPYQLSSGEKQMLVILLTVLLQESEPWLLMMDEPEISLHVEWQQRLVSIIRDLNPNAQVILTTHSPAMIMNGWLDAVTEVCDITID